MRTGKTRNGVGIDQLQGVPRTRPPHTWVLVGNQTGARIFERDEDERGGFRLLYRFDHPEGKLKASSLGTDRPGRTFDSPRSGRAKTSAARHTYSSEQNPREHAVDKFVTELADWLEAERKTERYDRLLLVAEPRFLGRMKRRLDDKTAERLLPPLERDFAYVTDLELFQEIDEALAPARRH